MGGRYSYFMLIALYAIGCSDACLDFEGTCADGVNSTILKLEEAVGPMNETCREGLQNLNNVLDTCTDDSSISQSEKFIRSCFFFQNMYYKGNKCAGYYDHEPDITECFSMNFCFLEFHSLDDTNGGAELVCGNHMAKLGDYFSCVDEMRFFDADACDLIVPKMKEMWRRGVTAICDPEGADAN